MAKVMDVMGTNYAPGLVPSDSIAHAAQQMRSSGCGVLPVCENGRFQGAVTERDIVLRVVASELDANICVREIMSNHLPQVSPEADVVHALDLMVSSGTRAVPVIQDSRFIGLLTLDDLARESPALAALVYYRTAKVQLAKSMKV